MSCKYDLRHATKTKTHCNNTACANQSDLAEPLALRPGLVFRARGRFLAKVSARLPSLAATTSWRSRLRRL